MSVYIPGMEMPERCWDCDHCYDRFYCIALGVLFSDREDFEPGERRLCDCPLVLVPPHGRLIDADSKTFPTLHRNPSNDYMKGWNACLRSVQQQPTIIPAEPPKEETE